MKWHDSFGCWLRRPRPAQPPASRRRELRLYLEQLEDRTVPSSFTAANVSVLEKDNVQLAEAATNIQPAIRSESHSVHRFLVLKGARLLREQTLSPR